MTDIDPETYARIEALIASDTSPVGIDAKKTHVLILHKLVEIERRLAALEAGRRADATQLWLGLFRAPWAVVRPLVVA